MFLIIFKLPIWITMYFLPVNYLNIFNLASPYCNYVYFLWLQKDNQIMTSVHLSVPIYVSIPGTLKVLGVMQKEFLWTRWEQKFILWLLELFMSLRRNVQIGTYIADINLLLQSYWYYMSQKLFPLYFVKYSMHKKYFTNNCNL